MYSSILLGLIWVVVAGYNIYINGDPMVTYTMLIIAHMCYIIAELRKLNERSK